MGGSDEQNEGQWEWVTGDCEWNWTDWGVNFNEGSNEHCLYIRGDVHWADQNCNQERAFLCEFD